MGRRTDQRKAPGGLADGAHLRAVLGGLRSLQAVLEERLPDEARLAGLRSRVTQLRRTWRSWKRAAAGAAALAALRTESEALLAALRPLEELAAEVQLRTKEAAAAEELVVLVRRYAAGREGLRRRCGTPQPRPGGVPGPPPALA